MKYTFILLIIVLIISTNISAQISFDEVDVEDWIGTGQNEIMFVVDFDSDPVGADSAFAWGIRFDNDSISGIEILSLIAQVNNNFTFDASGIFLNNINYFSNNQNFTNPNTGWFSILEADDGINWVWNNGITDNIVDGYWLGIVVMDIETYEAAINIPLLSTKINGNFKTTLEVFPNPVSDQLFIQNTIPSRIVIADLSGKIVFKSYSKIEKIDVSDFVPGLYVVTIINTNSSISEKLIVR